MLGLTLSMIFRFIPLLKARFREISMGQRCMGRHVTGGFMAKLRQVTKEVSILISWSLEAAIETSDSMEARGYGLPGRTSFHLFKMLVLLGAHRPVARRQLELCVVGTVVLCFSNSHLHPFPVFLLHCWSSPH